ncbi:unnamed protein product [Fusarium venenatum]|uniref:Uncharacterized protein n=1 Tax=Fusarium venenatum TaxID=56646 RepID=A0A2L2TB45_9HYPO|nr:uncharacterized protein FVRRES_08259 [Fusarium venenatum]CEI68182.1 unnamed protein product [Fusarium venenatum]
MLSLHSRSPSNRIVELGRGMSFQADQGLQYGAQNPPLSGDHEPSRDQAQWNSAQDQSSIGLGPDAYAYGPPEYANPYRGDNTIDPRLLMQPSAPEYQPSLPLTPSHVA